MLQDIIDVSIKKRAMLQRQLAALVRANYLSDEQREAESLVIHQQIINATQTIARCEKRMKE